MSAQANITAYDGASTPVVHTFVPVSNSSENGLLSADWREAVAANPIVAQARVKIQKRKLKSGVIEVTCIVTVPVMESVSGQNASGYTAAPKVAYENTVVFKGYFSPRATIAERRLARQLLVNMAGNQQTSVTPQTGGFLPELIDQDIFVS